MNEDQQEAAWRDGWRPKGYTEPSQEERDFARAHPGWLQAAWAHPEYAAWIQKRKTKKPQKYLVIVRREYGASIDIFENREAAVSFFSGREISDERKNGGQGTTLYLASVEVEQTCEEG